MFRLWRCGADSLGYERLSLLSVLCLVELYVSAVTYRFIELADQVVYHILHPELPLGDRVLLPSTSR